MNEKEFMDLIKNPRLLEISFNNMDFNGLKIDIIGKKECFYIIFW